MPTNASVGQRLLHFVLLPEFSLMGFVSAIEPLRVANRFHSASYQWKILSLDGSAVVASNGMTIQADGAFSPQEAHNTNAGIIVVAGFKTPCNTVIKA